MRTELWGLRDKETHEPIYTYWASSNKYRALFINKGTAESACRNPRNPNMEPFCIAGDPVLAAVGCRCVECKYRGTCDHTIRIVPTGPCERGSLHGHLHGCEYGVIGDSKEAQDDDSY